MRRYGKMGLHGLSVTEILIRAELVHEQMDGKPLFPDPVPDMITFRAAIDLLLQRQQVVVNVGGGKDNTLARNLALRELKNMMRQLVTYVNLVADGDPEIVLESGFPLRELPSPVGIVSTGKVEISTEDLNPGELKMYLQGDKRSSAYHFRLRKVGQDDQQQWMNRTSTKPRKIFTGLESGELYEGQVAIETSAGVGPWSQLVQKRPQ